MGTNIKPIVGNLSQSILGVQQTQIQQLGYNIVISINRALHFETIKKAVADIITAEAASGPDVFKTWLKVGTVSAENNKDSTVIPTTVIDVDKVKGAYGVLDHKGRRRGLALANLYNQIAQWQNEISIKTQKAFETYLPEFQGSDFDINEIREAVTRAVLPDFERKLQKDGQWWGLIGATLKGYFHLLPPIVQSLLNAKVVPPGGYLANPADSSRVGSAAPLSASGKKRKSRG